MNKPSIFGAEESSDSDDGGDWVKKAMMTKKETKKEGDSSEEEVEEVKGQAEDDSKKAKTYADMLEEEEIRSPVRWAYSSLDLTIPIIYLTNFCLNLVSLRCHFECWQARHCLLDAPQHCQEQCSAFLMCEVSRC